MLKLFTEILSKERESVWTKLKDFSSVGILGGGTALALQLNHRISYDFDIFSHNPIEKNLLHKVGETFPDQTIKTIVDSSDELTIEVDNVKVTFLYYPFNQLFPSVKTASVAMFDVKDIIADKAYTIGRRGAWRDYYDIYWILKEGLYSLGDVIDLASRKFGDVFNKKLFLEQLTYFDDIKDFSIEVIGKHTTEPKEIQKILAMRVKSYLSSSKML